MARRVVAEFLGTALLLLAIVGSGITAAIDGASSTQLFQHAIVVGAALTALILTFGHLSGGHFNPVVTLVDAAFGGMSWRSACGYVAAQTAGAVIGVVAANAMFDLDVISLAATERAGAALTLGEAVATFGLLIVIFGVVHSGRLTAVPAAVGAYIGGAIYFTSSTSFANPAVTVARMLTDTYTGIAPTHVPAFLVAQALGALAAAVVIRWLFAPDSGEATQVVVPHEEARDAATEPSEGVRL